MKGFLALLLNVLADRQQVFRILLCASMMTGASSHPAKIETQGSPTPIVQGFLQNRHDIVIHAAAVKRVRVCDYGDIAAAALVKERLQEKVSIGNHYRCF